MTRTVLLVVLLGLAMLIAAVFIGAGPDWGAVTLGVAGGLVLLVGLAAAAPRPGDR